MSYDLTWHNYLGVLTATSRHTDGHARAVMYTIYESTSQRCWIAQRQGAVLRRGSLASCLEACEESEAHTLKTPLEISP